MFEQVFETLRKTTEITLQAQQELFKKWTSLWPGVAASPMAFAEPQKYQQAWAEVVGELIKRQRETLEAQFKAGLQSIEDAFQIAQAKDPEEVRTKTLQLWQKTFDSLRQLYEAQVRDFQAAAAKWTEAVAKGAA
jgi:hypothetical protein